MNIGNDQSQLNRPRLLAFALALITLLVYLPVCFHEWIFFDDPAYVLDNNVVHSGLTWVGIKWAFVGWHASNWHPLTWLSHMLDCQLFGLNPGAQHFINVLFHAANAVLLFLLWHRMTRQLWPSALVAALFAWHPLHVESVAWISERKDVLSTFFGLLALFAYVGYVDKSKVQSPKSKVEYLLVIIFFALGLMAKPMLVTLPFVMLLLDFWPLRRISANGTERGIYAASTEPVRYASEPSGASPIRPLKRSSTRRDRAPIFVEKILFFVLTAASCIVTFLAQRQHAVVSLREYTLGLRLENVLVSYARYLLKAFCPIHLAVFYPLPNDIPLFEVIGAGALLVLVSTFAWQLRGKNPSVLVGWLWFLGTLVPVSGLVQVGSQAMADRYMYLPAVGLFVAVVFGIADSQKVLKFRAMLTPAATLVLLACIALTVYQLQFWQNTQTLFTRALAITKNNGPAHMMLGVWFERSGQPEEALRQYQLGLECDPSLIVQVTGGEKRPLAAQVQLLLGQSAEQERRPDEALAHYRNALQLDSNLVEAYNNIGNLLDSLGKPAEALTNYQAALRLRPDEPLVHENLGTQLVELGRFEDAMSEYEEASRLAPSDPRPFYLMGKAWLRRGQSAKAIMNLETAVRNDANDYQSLTFLARIFASDEDPQVRNGKLAVQLADKANGLTEGKQPFVLASLAMAYAEAGRFEDARRTATDALHLTATNTEAYSNLENQLQLYEANHPFRESFTNAGHAPAQ